MYKVYDIQTGYNYSQTYCVVAKSMGDAERIFLAKHDGPTHIKEIELHSEYVQIQDVDEQAKED